MALQGFATGEGTARYRERFGDALAAGHFRFEQGLWLSSVGLGTYLGSPDEATDRSYADAVARAVGLGANVIDTAANYRFQRSERSVGEALRRLSAAGFARDELLTVISVLDAFALGSALDSAAPAEVWHSDDEDFAALLAETAAPRAEAALDAGIAILLDGLRARLRTDQEPISD